MIGQPKLQTAFTVKEFTPRYYQARTTNSGSFFGCFQKTQGRAGKNSSPILGKKLKILESTQNFVQKSKGNLTFKDPLLQG